MHHGAKRVCVELAIGCTVSWMRQASSEPGRPAVTSDGLPHGLLVQRHPGQTHTLYIHSCACVACLCAPSQDGEHDVWRQLCEKLGGNLELIPDRRARTTMTDSNTDKVQEQLSAAAVRHQEEVRSLQQQLAELQQELRVLKGQLQQQE